MVDIFSLVTLTLLHSLWQSAILVWGWQLSSTSLPTNKKYSSLFVPDTLIAFQILISIVTYFTLSVHSYHGVQFFNIKFSLTAFLTQHQLLFITCYTLFFLHRLMLNIKGIQSLARISSAEKIRPSIEIRDFTQQMAKKMGIQKPLKVWFSATVTTPLTYGFLKPVILLPLSLTANIPSSSVEMLIIHELNHIRKNDFLRNIILVMAEQIYCINPFFIYLCKTSRLKSEMDSDEMVIRLNYNPFTYAELLLTTAKKAMHGHLLTVQFTGPRRELFTRINRITQVKPTVSSTRHHFVTFLFLLMVLGITISTSDFSLQKTTQHPLPFTNNITTSATKATASRQSISMKNETVSSFSAEGHVLNSGKKRMKNNEVQNEISDQDITLNSDTPFHAFPITTVRNSGTHDEVKQILVKEEDPSNRRSITKVYAMKKDNGQWKAHLISIIIEHQTDDAQDGAQ